MKPQHYSKLLLIWSIVSLVYGLEFFVRISPNILQSALQQELTINYTKLGELSAAFYYAYALCQIPSTLLMLKYGLKKTFLSFSLIFMSGLFLFSYSTSYYYALCARILMGIGSSLTFTILLELAHQWFDKKDFSFYVGIANSVGTLGAICAEYPLKLALNHYLWQTLMRSCAYLTLVLLLLFYCFFSTETKQHHHPPTQESVLNHLNFLAKVIFIGFAMVLPIIILPEMWGAIVMQHCHHLSSLEGAWILSFFFVGTGIGSMMKGPISLKRDTTQLIKIALCIEFLGLLCFILNPWKTTWALALSSLIIGMAASFMLLIFTIIQKKFEQPSLYIAITNVGIILFSVCIQPLMGYYLDYTTSLEFPMDLSLKIALSCLPLVLIPAYTITHYLKL